MGTSNQPTDSGPDTSNVLVSAGSLLKKGYDYVVGLVKDHSTIAASTAAAGVTAATGGKLVDDGFAAAATKLFIKDAGADPTMAALEGAWVGSASQSSKPWAIFLTFILDIVDKLCKGMHLGDRLDATVKKESGGKLGLNTIMPDLSTLTS